jgi:3-oxoacyl-(acyl-carrier-protein) synthase
MNIFSVKNRRLTEAFQIKSNIGHSEAAAGLSGLIKAVMILETGHIPGNPTFETPNPNSKCRGAKDVVLLC